MRLNSDDTGALQLSLMARRAAVLFRKGNPLVFHFPGKSGLVDAEYPSRRQAIVSVIPCRIDD